MYLTRKATWKSDRIRSLNLSLCSREIAEFIIPLVLGPERRSSFFRAQRSVLFCFVLFCFTFHTDNERRYSNPKRYPWRYPWIGKHKLRQIRAKIFSRRVQFLLTSRTIYFAIEQIMKMKSRLFLVEIVLNPKIQRYKRQILMATDMKREIRLT